MTLIRSKSEFLDDVPDQARFGKERIQVIHNATEVSSQELENTFQDDPKIVIIEIPSEIGGGQGSALVDYLFLAFAVNIVWTFGKSFIEELGRQTASSLIKVLSKRKNPSVIRVLISKGDDDSCFISILIPADCEESDLRTILEKIEKEATGLFEKRGVRHLVYEQSGKTMKELYR